MTDLGAHVDNMMKLLEEQNNKELLEEKLTKEINNLQITPPKLDTIINPSVAKKFSQPKEKYTTMILAKMSWSTSTMTKKSC